MTIRLGKLPRTGQANGTRTKQNQLKLVIPNPCKSVFHPIPPNHPVFSASGQQNELAFHPSYRQLDLFNMN